MVEVMQVNTNAVLLHCKICGEDKDPIPFGNPLKKTSLTTFVAFALLNCTWMSAATACSLG